MSDNNTSFHEQSEYWLESAELGRVKGNVIGWESDLMKMKRSVNNTSVVNTVSFNIEFIGKLADYLTECKKLFISPKLTKFINNPKVNGRVKVYEAYVDITKYKRKNGKVKVNLTKTKLEAIIKSFKSKKMELETLKSFNDKDLLPLKKHTLNVNGQDLFFKTVFESQVNTSFVLHNETNSNHNRGSSIAIPLKIKTRDHINAINTDGASGGDNSPNGDGNGITGWMFYANAERDTTLNIKFNVSFKSRFVKNILLNEHRLFFNFHQYKDGTDYIFKKSIMNKEIPVTVSKYNSSFSFDAEIDVSKGDSLSINVHQFMDGADILNKSELDIEISDISSDLTIKENSHVEKSEHKVILIYELIERTLQVMTGRKDKKLFRSKALGRKDLGYKEDGEFAYLSSASGFMIRQFENKNYTTSFTKEIESLFAITGLTYGIEVDKNGIETVVLEPLKSFYPNDLVLNFAKPVFEFEESFNNKIQFNEVSLGYSKGAENYEEKQGLNDPNGKATYTTPFLEQGRTYTIISSKRADMVGHELMRRLSFDLYPNRDAFGDNDNWVLDCKMELGILTIRTWKDFLSTEPLNLFSSDSYGNLNLIPSRNLLRHSWYLSSSLSRFTGKNIKRTSTIGNGDVILDGLEEKRDVKITTFEHQRFSDTLVEFETSVNYEFQKLLEGYTTINGVPVSNFLAIWGIKADGKDYNVRLLEFDGKKKFKASLIN